MKTICINEDKLLLLGESYMPSNFNLLPDKITLYHGTNLEGLSGILESGIIDAGCNGINDETNTANWFSIDSTVLMNKGVLCSITVDKDDFITDKFQFMNSIHVVSTNKRIPINDYNFTLIQVGPVTNDVVKNCYRKNNYDVKKTIWELIDLFGKDLENQYFTYDLYKMFHRFVSQQLVNKLTTESRSLTESNDYDAVDMIMFNINEPLDPSDVTTYDLELYNIDRESMGWLDDLTIDEIEDDLGSEIKSRFENKQYRQSGNQFIMDDILSTAVDDIYDINKVNDKVKKLFNCSTNYYQGTRGYILTDGTIVSFGDYKDHASISLIHGMTIQSFVGLGNIRIGDGFISLSKLPTTQQRGVLFQLIQSYSNSELYVDIIKTTDDGSMYGKNICGAKYINPKAGRVLGEINRFFTEGIKLAGNNLGENKHLAENITMEVEPDEVNTDSFKVKKRLNQKIWDGNIINSRVRLKLLEIADDFSEYANIQWLKNKKHTIMTGSMCNYNWSKYSDIDVHIIIDFNDISDDIELVTDYFNMKKNEWNNDHNNLTIFGYKVELYIENINSDRPTSQGVYDLDKNEWISMPSKHGIKPMTLTRSSIIKRKSAKIMTQIDDLIDLFQRTKDKVKLARIGNKINHILNCTQRMRKIGLEKHGENSLNNIVYKVLRRTKYLDKLWGVNLDIYDTLNSIN